MTFRLILASGLVALASGTAADSVPTGQHKTIYGVHEHARINELEVTYQSLTDEQLRAKTVEFRARVAAASDKRAVLNEVVMKVFQEPKYKAMVAEVDDVRDLTRNCPTVMKRARGIPERAKVGEPLDVLVCRSWVDAAGGGDFYVVPAYGSFWDGEIVDGKGTSHGTPYLHDRTVAMFVRAPGAKAGRNVKEPVDFSAYSAVYASLLGLGGGTPDAIIDSLTAH